MDFASVFGLIIGIGSIVIGYVMGGGAVSSLWLLSAVIITLGGSLGAVFVSFGMAQLRRMPGLMLSALLNPNYTIEKTAETLHSYAKSARQNGLLSLERLVSEQPNTDPFLKKSVLMAVGGTDSEKICEVLENDVEIDEQRRMTEIQMFDTMAAYCPAFGMIGTIVGLVQVLSAGMENPDDLTKAIGIAFITTLYGVVLANLLFTPMSTKLKTRIKNSRLEKEMIIEGVCAIRNGINPRLLQEQLSSYVASPSPKRKRAKKAAEIEMAIE